MSKSISLHTLGCKLNYSETSTIAKDFSSRGFKIKNYGEKSDIFLLNTCSVTANADKECRQIVRSVIKNNPETYVIITGCYAQLSPGEISSIEGVDLVLGNNEKFKIFDYLDNYEKKDFSCVYRESISKANDFYEAFSRDTDYRTRAFLKIQDGCNYKCSFCTIPQARGKSRSLAINKVVENAMQIIDAGYKEIVLTGVNTGDYDYTNERLENRRLIDVLYELDKLDIERIRISSIEPNLLSNEIISLVKSSEKFCKHLHIPLQSGSTEILKLMRRRYNAGFYENLVHRLNEEINNVGIGVDVIVGFPGESEKHFDDTYNFINDLPVSYLHVFSYSERRNTDAIQFSNPVEIKERKRRSMVMRNLSSRKRFEFYSKFLGTTQEILFETKKNAGCIEGLTGNYIRVKVKENSNLENTIQSVILTQLDGINPVYSVCVN